MFPRETIDVLVIGGGPAGATAASLLKHYAPSRTVVIAEQATFPRAHVGESLLPESNRILHKLGVLPAIERAGFIRKRGVTYKWAHDRPRFSEVFSNGVLDALAGTAAHIPDYAWQVDRSRYDQVLLEHAAASGVDVRQRTRVGRVHVEAGRVTGATIEGPCGVREVDAQFVVDCSGQARLVGRALGLSQEEYPLGDLAIYRYYSGFRWVEPLIGAPRTSKIFFAATTAGWFWFIPLSETLTSVGLVTRREFLRTTTPDALYDAQLAQVPELAELLGDAVPARAPADPEAPRTHTVADWSYRHGAPGGPGYFLAGDAAAFVDPILSSGVLLAHQSGLSVANAINTLWCGHDLTEAELDEGYSKFYLDLYSGFLRMASWWYHQRAVSGVDEWHRLARELGRDAKGARELGDSDTASFMTFAAGFLTDYRFAHIGLGFGDAGLALSADALAGKPVSQAIKRSIDDRSMRPRRAFERLDVSAWVGTSIDSDRWWRLPQVHFSGGEVGERTWRAPIAPERHGADWVEQCVLAIERLLKACDGRHSVEELVRTTRDQFPPDRAAPMQTFCNQVLADLLVLGVLRA